MHDIELPELLKLDPWTTSSLLQKAIRRGEVELARRAGQTLYRQRGIGIFRRLSTIAVEDIGIADIALLQDVVRLGTDKSLRSVLGSDADLIDDLCSRMARATKDRSADYLICASTMLETANSERLALKRLTTAKLIETAIDPLVPLIRRAVAAQLACASPRDPDKFVPGLVEHLLEAFSIKPLPLHNAVLDLVRSNAEPFCLMLPLIWSRWWHSGAEADTADDQMPVTEFERGIPLYALDKHTAAGKQAIRAFVGQTEEVTHVLAKWAPRNRWVDVTCITVFYADGAPVARRLDWGGGRLLARSGFIADMTDAGCDLAGADKVLDCVQRNLADLNRCRRTAVSGRPLKQ